MTLADFNRDIAPIVQLVVMTLGLAIIVMVWYQIRQTRLWNKLLSGRDYFDLSRLNVLDRALHDSFLNIGIDTKDIHWRIEKADVEKIRNDADAYLALKNYLNHFEGFCAAVCVGVADNELAYAIHSSQVCRTFNQCEEFIKVIRTDADDGDIWIELEKVAHDWAGQDTEIKARAAKKAGVQPKV